MNNNDSFEQMLSEIINALKEAGHDPYAQLHGYLQTGDEIYITRRNNARFLIRELDKERLTDYVKSMQ